MSLESFEEWLRSIFGGEKEVVVKPTVKVVVSEVKQMPFKEMNSGYKNITTLINLFQLDWEKDLFEWGYDINYALLYSSDYDIYVGFYGDPKFLLKANQGLGIYTDNVRNIYVKPSGASASVYAMLFRY